MGRVNIVSWNVNGIRAIHRKNAFDWFFSEKPDILCLQEVKAEYSQMPGEFLDLDDYMFSICPSERKGYSGVAIYSKDEPLEVSCGLGEKRFDHEGRLIVAEYSDFTLFNVYFPNGKASSERLRFKMEFYDAFLERIESLRAKGKHIIFCGDVNTAHREIDLARPRQNESVSGFLPEERAWIDRLIGLGYVDTFREFNSEPGQYSWWDLKSRARDRNVGWRIDYFFISPELRKNLVYAYIRPEITGSDHCPVGVELEFP